MAHGALNSELTSPSLRISARWRAGANGPRMRRTAAKGVQIYVCRVEGAANVWDFKAPEAELFDAQGQPFAKHYAGPTWEAPDGSKAVGKVLANEPDSKAGAIPWLLLSAASPASGVLPGVRFVPRGTTSAGVAPTSSRRRARVRSG